MTDLTIYGDYVMATVTDPFFRWLSNDHSPEFADGDVEAPSGWFAVIDVTRDDLATFASLDGDPTLDRYIKPDRWYLVQIDNLGFIYTISYEGLDGLRPVDEQRRRALADFSRLTRMYNEWSHPLNELTADWKVIRRLSDAIGEMVDEVTNSLLEEYGTRASTAFAERLSDRIYTLATTGKEPEA